MILCFLKKETLRQGAAVHMRKLSNKISVYYSSKCKKLIHDGDFFQSPPFRKEVNMDMVLSIISAF